MHKQLYHIRAYNSASKFSYKLMWEHFTVHVHILLWMVKSLHNTKWVEALADGK